MLGLADRQVRPRSRVPSAGAGAAGLHPGDPRDQSESGPVKAALRAERALRAAPVVLVRGVRVPASTEAAGSRISCQGKGVIGSHGRSAPESDNKIAVAVRPASSATTPPCVVQNVIRPILFVLSR